MQEGHCRIGAGTSLWPATPAQAVQDKLSPPQRMEQASCWGEKGLSFMFTLLTRICWCRGGKYRILCPFLWRNDLEEMGGQLCPRKLRDIEMTLKEGGCTAMLHRHLGSCQAGAPSENIKIGVITVKHRWKVRLHFHGTRQGQPEELRESVLSGTSVLRADKPTRCEQFMFLFCFPRPRGTI